MIELGIETNIAMGLILSAMGVYFVKSADLPKDLKMRAQSHGNGVMLQRRPFAHSKNNMVNNNNEQVKLDMKKQAQKLEAQRLTKELGKQMEQAKLMASRKIETENLKAQANQVSRKIDINKLNRRIDQLTMAIMTLEMELKDNNSKNNAILDQINTYMNELEILNSKKMA